MMTAIYSAPFTIMSEVLFYQHDILLDKHFYPNPLKQKRSCKCLYL